MELREVPEDLRRQYYDASYRDRPLPPVFERATPEQAIALGRIKWPGASDRRLLELSGVPRLRQLAATRSAAPRKPQDPPLRFHLERRETYDLNDALRAGHERISLQHIKSITNIVPEPSLPTRLRALWLAESGGGPQPAAARRPLDELSLTGCGEALERAALASYAAEVVGWVSGSLGPFSASRLAADQPGARSVSLTAARLHDVRALRDLPATQAALTRIESADDLAELLVGWGDRLETLTVGTMVPVSPEVLSPCRRLTRLRLEARPENADPWIDWATAHPDTAVQFVTDGSITRLPTQVAELYRGVPVFGTAGKTGKLSVELDLVDLFDLPFDDNGALEDALEKIAKKDQKKIGWGSEASTFVARCPDLDTARWLIDAALATKGRG